MAGKKVKSNSHDMWSSIKCEFQCFSQQFLCDRDSGSWKPKTWAPLAPSWKLGQPVLWDLQNLRRTTHSQPVTEMAFLMSEAVFPCSPVSLSLEIKSSLWPFFLTWTWSVRCNVDILAGVPFWRYKGYVSRGDSENVRWLFRYPCLPHFMSAE